MDRFNKGFQFALLQAVRRLLLLKMLVVAAPADQHDSAKQSHWVRLLLPLDEVVFYFDSLAKKAAAFFKISRSMRSVLFSLRSR